MSSDSLLTILNNSSMTQSMKKERFRSSTVRCFLSITFRFKNIQNSSERYNFKMQKTLILIRKISMRGMIQSSGTRKKN